MTADQVKKMLPVIIAFAARRPIQFRDLRPGKNYSDEWLTINPDTTEFRLGFDTNPDEWRVTPNVLGNLLPFGPGYIYCDEEESKEV